MLYAKIAVDVVSMRIYKMSCLARLFEICTCLFNSFIIRLSLLSCTLKGNNQCAKTRTKTLPKAEYKNSTSYFFEKITVICHLSRQILIFQPTTTGGGILILSKYCYIIIFKKKAMYGMVSHKKNYLQFFFYHGTRKMIF